MKMLTLKLDACKDPQKMVSQATTDKANKKTQIIPINVSNEVAKLTKYNPKTLDCRTRYDSLHQVVGSSCLR